MGATTSVVVKTCLLLARVKIGFEESSKELELFQIRGPGYKWGVGFVRALHITSASNNFVLACIEHFTKMGRVDSPTFQILQERCTTLLMYNLSN